MWVSEIGGESSELQTKSMRVCFIILLSLVLTDSGYGKIELSRGRSSKPSALQSRTDPGDNSYSAL